MRIIFTAKLFKDNNMWQKGILELKDTSVVKMRRIIQSVFYLLQYKREDICIKGTNKLFWKVA